MYVPKFQTVHFGNERLFSHAYLAALSALCALVYSTDGCNLKEHTILHLVSIACLLTRQSRAIASRGRTLLGLLLRGLEKVVHGDGRRPEALDVSRL